MAKKKTASGNVAFQVRLDAQTHAELKKVADETEMSLNQLVTGLLRGCAANLHPGEAGRTREGFVTSTLTPKCAFVGSYGEDHSQEDLEFYRSIGEEPPEPPKGEIWFSLDYSGRGYVPGR